MKSYQRQNIMRMDMWAAAAHFSDDVSATNMTNTSNGMTSKSPEAMVGSITPPLSFRHVDLSPIPTDSARTETEKSTE